MSRLWRDLNLSAETLRHLTEDCGFIQATSTQASCLPEMMKNQDVAVEACTGSGKTLAFVVPIIERLLKEAKARESSDNSSKPAAIRAMFLSPTRELATQIHEVVTGLIKSSEVFSSRMTGVCFVGGRDEEFEKRQMKDMKQNQIVIVIGTPGRVRHCICESIQLKDCEYLVLDEADRLMDSSFEQDMQVIFKSIPKQRRTFLFSATLSGQDLSSLVKKAGMRNPRLIRVTRKRQDAPGTDTVGTAKSSGSGSTATSSVRHELPSQLINKYALVPQSLKLPFLWQFLNAQITHTDSAYPDSSTTHHATSSDQQSISHWSSSQNSMSAVVFFLTCASVEFYYSLLKECKTGNFKVFRLHSKMTSSARTATMAEFRETPNGLLLCTDLVARGIDVSHVQWIIQFDAPTDPNFFVHRVGRTARAGKDGGALLLLNPNEQPYIAFLQGRGVNMDQVTDLVEQEAAAGAQSGHVTTGHITTAQSTTRSVQQGPSLSEEWSSISLRTRFTEQKREHLTRSSKAFVSYIRAYQSHNLNFIFSLKELDIGDVAMSFCCLRVPRVKEILGKNLGTSFTQSLVDPASIKFLDKVREKNRLNDMIEKKNDLLKEKDERMTKKQRLSMDKSNIITQAVDPKHERTRSEKRQTQRVNRQAEWDDLAKEERLAKKLKHGKISKKEYERLLMKIDDESDDTNKSSDEASSSSEVSPSDAEQHGDSDSTEYSEVDDDVEGASVLDSSTSSSEYEEDDEDMSDE